MDDASAPCPVCGQSHANAYTDFGFELPDDALKIPDEARPSNVKYTADLCQMQGRNFVRCVLQVPFSFRPGNFGWGVWVEVEWPAFQRYIELSEQDAPAREPQRKGKIANQLPFPEPSVGGDVVIQFGLKTKRPTVHFAKNSKHYMAEHQKQGYSAVDYHTILAGLGQL